MRKIVSRRWRKVPRGNYGAVLIFIVRSICFRVSDEIVNRFVQKQVAELDDEIGRVKESKGPSCRIVKELEKAKKTADCAAEDARQGDEGPR